MGAPRRHGSHAELHGHGVDAVVERVLATLAAHGERVTRPRRRVVAVLANEHEHRTAEEIVEALGEISPPVHRATVYRTLELLADLEIATRTHMPSDVTGYHLTITGEGHEHLHARCRRCGHLVVLPVDALHELAESLRASEHFDLDPWRSELVGLCGQCRGRQPPDSGATSSSEPRDACPTPAVSAAVDPDACFRNLRRQKDGTALNPLTQESP